MATNNGRLAAGWVLLLLGGGAAVAGALIRRQAVGEPPQAEEAANRAVEVRERITPALSALGQDVLARAHAAAEVPELVAGLDIDVDAKTFQDLFESEDWWGPFRSPSSWSALMTTKGTLAFLAAGAPDLSRDPVVLKAREAGEAVGFTAGQSGAFSLAAVKVTKGKHPELGAVVVIGREVATEDLRRITDDPRGLRPLALALSDGVRLFASTGTAEGVKQLGSLLPFVAPSGGGATPTLQHGAAGDVATWSIGPHLWSVALVAASPAVTSDPATRGWPLLGGGAAVALLGLIFLLRAPKTAPSPGQSAPGVAVGPAPLANENREPPPRGQGAPPEAAALAGPSVAQPVPLSPAPGGAGAMLSAVSGGIPGALPSSLATPGSTGRETLTMSHPLGAGAASPALAVAPVSTQMGRYTLVERIGEGGMAEIFFARSHGAEGFMRELVVKRMHPHLARNRLAVNQFIDEARVQAELVHPNIVPVLDFGKAGDEYFLALDLIRGRDLGKVIARHVETSGESLSLPVAFYVMHEVLEALEFAHTKKGRDGRPLEVVHRDVAPGNVLISFLGEVKLSDFGIAKAEHRVSFTEIGMVKGNASFMSPEQARGEDVDHRSDIFSAGVVLFYMLTAKLLYRGETTLNQLLRAAVGPATSQFNTLASLPPVAQSILTRALAVDVKERFQTARDFAVTLAPFMASRKDLNALMGSLFPSSERLSGPLP